MSIGLDLYTRPGCHLCSEARAVIEGVLADFSEARLREWNVDADPVLRLRYGEEVPVLTVNGIPQAFFRIDAPRLRAALTAARQSIDSGHDDPAAPTA